TRRPPVGKDIALTGGGHAMKGSVICCAALAAAAFAGGASAQTICGAWQTAPALNGPVYAIAQFQGETYLGGQFSGISGSCVTRWNGSSYVPLPNGLVQGHTNALAVYDSGTGAALYAGGESFDLPTQPSTRIYGVARWNGQVWSGTGFPDERVN